MSSQPSGKSRAHLPFVLLLVLLTAYLGLKTLPEEGWSGWKWGSAQTLLTLEHWDRDGAFHHKLLFIPIGYSKSVGLIDDPEMRHHARGIVTGALAGQRLYYTHYPPGYLFPHALLKKAGVDARAGFRLLALAFSLAALTFMYAFFCALATPAFAFLGVLYYAASTMFLDFSDSLANQPIDDLLRFAILLVSMAALGKEGRDRGRYTAALWLMYFLLAGSTYDSVLFIFVWLVGLDYAAWLGSKDRAGKGVPLKRWALLALAPALTFSLQVLQNWWYLGWEDLLLDFKGVFLYRVASGAPGGIARHFTEHLNVIRLATGLDAWIALPALALVVAAFVALRKSVFSRWPELSIFVLLLLAGSAYTFVFARSTDLDYQGRQYAPAFSFVVGVGTVLLARVVKGPKALMNRRPALSIAMFCALAASLAVLWAGQVKRTVEYVRDWPNNVVDPVSLNAYKELREMSHRDAIIFSINQRHNKDYPQPPPTFEYYTGKMILNFRNPSDMERDFAYLRARAAEPFDAIIFSSRYELIEEYLPLSRGKEIRIIGGGGYYALLIEGGPAPAP